LLAPEKIDIEHLPSVALHDWKRLPQQTGLYFVLSDEPYEILYIGQARNLRKRWYTHKLLEPTMSIKLSVCRIAWIALSADALNDAELQSIAYWKPRLNCRPGGDVHIFMAEKFLTTMRLTPEAKRLLGLLAQHTGLSQTGIVELAIREKASRDIELQSRQRRESAHPTSG
jgi:hypothetical protein